MRILGFTKEWPKLASEEFTTFRYPRGDVDWAVGEDTQIVITPRSPNRKKLGVARILTNEPRELDPLYVDGGVPIVTEAEAMTDGFSDRNDMKKWMMKRYGLDYITLMNKLTLRWISREMP